MGLLPTAAIMPSCQPPVLQSVVWLKSSLHISGRAGATEASERSSGWLLARNVGWSQSNIWTPWNWNIKLTVSTNGHSHSPGEKLDFIQNLSEEIIFRKCWVVIITLRYCDGVACPVKCSTYPPAVLRRGEERERDGVTGATFGHNNTQGKVSLGHTAWWAANRLELIRDCFKLNHPDLLNVTICVWWSAGLRVLSTFLTSNHEESLPSEEELSQ